MKKLTYLLVAFALLVSFTSCEKEHPITGNFSVNIVNKAEIPLTIKSFKYTTLQDIVPFNESNISEMIINTELLPGESKTIVLPYEYDLNIEGSVNCAFKLDCSYNDNEIPVVGREYVSGFYTKGLLSEYIFYLPPECVQPLDFGLYTDYESKEQVYAIVERNWE